MNTEWRNLACGALQAVPQSASHAIPDGRSTVTKPSAFVRAQIRRFVRLHIPLFFVTLRACPSPPPVKICTCKNGVPEAGVGCHTNGAAQCKSCSAGFTMNKDSTECIRTLVPDCSMQLVVKFHFFLFSDSNGKCEV